jgi:anti-sigma regulatory factor (Ser/Thr protein kinase)
MAEIPNVRLTLSNRPDNVLVVRQALTGVAENVGLDALESNDLNTAVTEACNNVVQHAYEGEEGPLEVEIYALPGAVEVVVRDHGVGIRPHAADPEQTHSGIGLPVVHALTQSVGFSNLPGGGTEVRMQFAAPAASPPEPVPRAAKHADDSSGGAERADVASATVEMTLAPSTVARSVLPRVLSALAARAYFSTDRISDVQLVADTLVAHAGDSVSGSQLGVAVDLAPRNLEVRVGPLQSGAAEKLINTPAPGDGLGAIIERLTDGHNVAVSDSSEMLALRLVERP